MKSLFFALFALVVSSASAFADPGRPAPDFGRNCTVTFKKCDFNINGFCVKWNHKAFQIGRHQVRYACRMAEREYGMVRNCRVNCGRGW